MRKLALAVGWLMVAAVVWLSLTHSPPKLDVTLGDKLGHLAAYGTLMFWFCQLYARRATLIAFAMAFVAMGIALEFLQDAGGFRSFEWSDMGANTLGVLLGWGAALIFPRVLPARE
ncbi:MAG: VanZ family protein [Betaproteobacteria bacterium]|nr:MAG: VanZ family protein [Betaproteobacteria bacterium]